MAVNQERHFPSAFFIPSVTRSVLLFLVSFSSVCFQTTKSAGGEESQASKVDVVQLPRPNSGVFTFEQAEIRKHEILLNHPTPKLESWKNPYMGFCIHVNKDDSLTVYNHWLKPAGQFDEPDKKWSVDEIDKLNRGIPLGAKSAGMLITSDVTLVKSKTIHKLLRVIYSPSVQLFYARKRKVKNSADRPPK